MEHLNFVEVLKSKLSEKKNVLSVQIQADRLDGRLRAVILESEFGNSWGMVKDICESKYAQVLAEWIEAHYSCLRIWSKETDEVQELNIGELSLSEELEIIQANALNEEY